MIPHDYHVHTRFSADSKAPMQQMCAAAADRGIPEIGFTEHYDLHPDDEARDWFELEHWAEELERCRKIFAGRLVIRAGIEIGEPHLFPEAVGQMLARYRFDYALGSLHWVGRRNVFNSDFFARSQEEAFREYFEELERMTRVGEFQILAHLDIPIRAGFQFCGPYDPEIHEAVIRRILQNCIDRGIAMEINTGSLRRSAGVLNPGLAILKWYTGMGGRYLTLGSDSHRPEHVGAGLDFAMATAREAGLTSFTSFENCRPCVSCGS